MCVSFGAVNLVEEIRAGGTQIYNNVLYVVRDLHIDGLTLSLTELKPFKSTRGHSHDDIDEIYVFVCGSGYMQLGVDDIKETFAVGKGKVVLVRKGVFHRVMNESIVPLEFVSIFAKKRNNIHYQYAKQESVAACV